MGSLLIFAVVLSFDVRGGYRARYTAARGGVRESAREGRLGWARVAGACTRVGVGGAARGARQAARRRGARTRKVR